MADAIDKILRLTGKTPKEKPHGSDVAHNAAIHAVLSDKSGTANHAIKGGVMVHSIKNSDAAAVMSFHESHPGNPGHMPTFHPGPQIAKFTASNDGDPSDGLVLHGIMRKSELGKESAVEKARKMIEDPDDDGDDDSGPAQFDPDRKKDEKKAEPKKDGKK